jgi:hypothetical protein
MEVTKQQFHRILRIANAVTVEFDYNNNGNDVFNPCGTLQKQTKYDFYVIIENCDGGREKHLLVYKQHRRRCEDVYEELESRYLRWSKQVGVTAKSTQ